MLYSLLTLWLLKSIGSLSRTTSYWQVKEYRWDRMKDFFLHQGGVSVFFTLPDLLIFFSVLGGVLVWLISPTSEFFVTWFPVLIAVLLFAEVLELFHTLLKRQFRRPRPTFKALLILGTSFLLELAVVSACLYVWLPDVDLVELSLVLGFLVIIEHDINAFVVFALNGITNVLKRRVYRKAADKRASMSDLKVIGITGSFGKTSVKDYLAHILSGKFQVLKTPLNTNTEIGIAKVIADQLKPEHEVFVCEMGAYRMGEIRLCCLMAQPEIAIFTGLNEQHMALFGSIDNTFSAKWELPSSLPSNGLLIANGDSHELRDRLIPHRAETVVCRTTGDEAQLSDLEISTDHFDFQYKGQHFTAPLVGGFQAINVLMAIMAAERLGMSLESIAQQVATLQSPPKTLEVSQHGRITVCDDSYNVNTDGLRAAVEHLQLFEDHVKILFFPGMMELGDETERIHLELAEFVSHHVDHVFFFDPVHAETLSQGALQGGLSRSHIHTDSDLQDQIQVLNDLLEDQEKPLVVLFESRGAEAVMQWIKSQA